MHTSYDAYIFSPCLLLFISNTCLYFFCDFIFLVRPPRIPLLCTMWMEDDAARSIGFSFPSVNIARAYMIYASSIHYLCTFMQLRCAREFEIGSMGNFKYCHRRSCRHRGAPRRGAMTGHPITWHWRLSSGWARGNVEAYLLSPMGCRRWEDKWDGGRRWWWKGRRTAPDIWFRIWVSPREKIWDNIRKQLVGRSLWQEPSHVI